MEEPPYSEAHAVQEFLSAHTFDPEEVQPGRMDFTDFIPEEKKHHKGQKTKTDKEEGHKKKIKKEKKDDVDDGMQGSEGTVAADPGPSPRLPKRVLISAFSTKVGWRPTGVQSGQVKIFMERFPDNFSLLSMGRIVLPCCNGMPFVTKDNKFPCPITMNAIKLIQQNGRFNETSKSACRDLRQVLDKPALVHLVNWRKGLHYLHANAMHQYYMTSKQQELKGKIVKFDGIESQPMQVVVLKQALRKIEQADICNNQDVPKLLLSTMPNRPPY